MKELINELNRFKKLSGLNNLVEMQSKLNQYDTKGDKTGYWEEYYDNGKLDSKGNYKDDEEDGYWEYYNENGGLIYKGSYKNGKEDGYWNFFYDNGQLESNALYRNGEMINRFSTKEKNKVDTPKPQSNQQDQNRQEPTQGGKEQPQGGEDQQNSKRKLIPLDQSIRKSFFTGK